MSEEYGGNQNGFTLIEVLVAIIVLSIGLLGLATLQATGLRNTDSAYLRSQAALQAYDMTDRMRSNPQGVGAGAYDAISATPADPGCVVSGCTPAQMAQFDAHQWNTTNAAVLPSGIGTVSGNGTNSVFTITVAWDDEQSGTADTSFTLRFRP